MIANIFGRVLRAYKMSMVLVTGTRKSEEAERAKPPLDSTRSRAPKIDSDFEQLLTPKETAQFLRVSESWLAKARMHGDGPPFVKFGRAVRYRETDLVRWLKSRARLSTSER
jgi:predicted DNA-binding transcriptional regulator AlpA